MNRCFVPFTPSLAAMLVLTFLASAGCPEMGSLLPPADGGFTQDGPTVESTSGGQVEPSMNSDQSNQTPPVEKFSLWADGTNLRGANIYQRRVYAVIDGTDFLGDCPIGPPLTQEDFTALAALGANYVNLSHPGLFTETPPYVLDRDVEQNLDRLIDMAANAGLFVVISFRTGPGRSEFAIFEGQDWFPKSLILNTVWTDSNAQAAWSEMWAYTAERYRDTPNVVGYDLMVEPNGSSTTLGLWDPADFYPQYAGSLVDWNPMQASISAAIRVLDADTPILVNAMSYGSPSWLPYLKIDEARSVATVHHYLPFEYTHQGPDDGLGYPGRMNVDGVEVSVDRAWLEDVLAPLDDYRATTGVPVAINEFGVMRWAPGADAYFTDQTELFEQRGINHALWIWEADWMPLAEFDDFNFRHGPDPANHADVAAASLLDAIRSNWSNNRVTTERVIP